MKNYIWIIISILWTLCMLMAAFFGMRNDLKNEKNDSPYILKTAKNFLIIGIAFIVAGIIMLFFTKLVPNFFKEGIRFIILGSVFLLTSWSQRYKGKDKE